jgi:hypothetical protein
MNATTRQAINAELKKIKAAIRKKEDTVRRAEDEIDILKVKAADLDAELTKGLEDG